MPDRWSRKFEGHVRVQFSGFVQHSPLPAASSAQDKPSCERSTIEIHGSPGTSGKVRGGSGGSARCGGSRSREFAKDVRQPPLDVQIKECEGFWSRARSHLAELDTKQTMVSANIHETELLFHALKTQLQPSTAHGCRRGILASRDGCPDEGAVGSEVCFSRGTGIQACMQEGELQEWIGGRQADLCEAMVAGRPDEVARISDIMCQAVQFNSGNEKLQSEFCHFLVTNSVS